jgi:dihydroflavonol-4-reductase
MTVLVTGGTGYIAGWCLTELLARGYDVRTTVRSLDKAERVRRAVGRDVEVVAADLTADDGWAEAVRGCEYVLHVASPLGIDGSTALVEPARDGTLRVLRAAVVAGVKRVVVTSAANTASPSSYRDSGVSDETLWTDPDDPTLQPYRRSKTLAERAAWDFMKSTKDTTLTTILPGAVFGPILSPDGLGSVQIVARLLNGMPGTPKIGFEIVDVRDLADIHIRAMTAPSAAGERLLATGEFMWMQDMALALRSGLGDAASRVPKRNLPNVAVRLAALRDPALREILPALGRRHRHTTEKAERLLGWRPRPAAETVVACGQSLLEHGHVPAVR